MKYSFELARTRKKHLTSCTKSNGITITMPYWDERFAEMKKKYPDVQNGPVPRRRPHHPDGAEPRPLRRDRRLQPVRRHPLGPRPGDRRHHRHRRLGQHQPRAHRAVDLRAGARLGARHRRQEDRQPDRRDLVGRADARAPRPRRGRRRHRARDRARDHRRPAHARHEGQARARAKSAPRSPRRSAASRARPPRPAPRLLLLRRRRGRRAHAPDLDHALLVLGAVEVHLAGRSG